MAFAPFASPLDGSVVGAAREQGARSWENNNDTPWVERRKIGGVRSENAFPCAIPSNIICATPNSDGHLVAWNDESGSEALLKGQIMILPLMRSEVSLVREEGGV